MKRSIGVFLLCAASTIAGAQQSELYDTPALRQFNAWLAAFNSANTADLRRFLLADAPSQFHLLGSMTTLRQRTGGFEPRKVMFSTDTRLTMLMQERASDPFAGITLDVEDWRPHRITRFSIGRLERPKEFAIRRLSDTELVDSLRARLGDSETSERFSGAVLLARDGHELFAGAIGQDRERDVANTIDTPFRLGTMTRMFTAVAVLQLAQHGRLRLGDPFIAHLPAYPDTDFAARVTIHDLLTRTAGTADDYAVLSRIVEHITGVGYPEYVREHVLHAAGMQATAIDSAGGSSTAGDLLRFATAILDHTLLDERFTELMTRGKVNTRAGKLAYGFVDAGTGPTRHFGAGGGGRGINDDLEVFPAMGYVVVVLANMDPPAARTMSEFIINRLSLSR